MAPGEVSRRRRGDRRAESGVGAACIKARKPAAGDLAALQKKRAERENRSAREIPCRLRLFQQ